MRSLKTVLIAWTSMGAATILVAEGTQLVLSEVMAASNSIRPDEDGDFSDWVEIGNTGDRAVDFEGWYLADEAGVARWWFPKMTLEAGKLLLVFASGKDRRAPSSELQANFKLDGDGKHLALIRPDGQTIESAFTPQYTPQIADASYGLSADLQGPGFFRRATPGQPNDRIQTQQLPAPISGPITLVLARDTQSIDETLARRCSAKWYGFSLRFGLVADEQDRGHSWGLSRRAVEPRRQLRDHGHTPEDSTDACTLNVRGRPTGARFPRPPVGRPGSFTMQTSIDKRREVS
ncbi:MAG: lamin tail domain-containing protein [Pirellulales bacterium]|nr:lamin tail domain-containing protein [Pirellulales bacterium]